MRRLALAPLLTAVLLAAGCLYPLDRPLKPGEVRAVVLRDDGEPADTALAALPGTERVTRADDSGLVLFSGVPAMDGVLQLFIDDDGDGRAEEGALLPFLTELLPHRKALSDGLTSTATDEVSGVDLGTVTLTPTVTLTGTVTEAGAALAAGRLAQVFAVVLSDIGSGAVATLPVSVSVAADATGAFNLVGVPSGDHRLLALVRTDGAQPDRVGTNDAEDIDVTLDATTLTPLEVPGSSSSERASIETVELRRAGTVTPVGVFNATGDALAPVIDLPLGVFDAQVDATTGAGLLFSVAVVPDLPRWVPVELRDAADACASDGERDCDRDGRTGLPPLAVPPDPTATWDACAAECGGLVGADLRDATCSTDAGSFDCDDDADGRADVDERACVGPLRGLDADNDGLCEPAADPFPGCADNTVALCP